MKLVRCVKCNTPVMSENSIDERFMEEKNDLMEELSRLRSIAHRKDINSKKIKSRISEVETQLEVLNDFFKMLNVQKRNDANQFFSKMLMEELKKIGYEKEFFKKAREKADRLYEENYGICQRARESFHNAWHNNKGQYDPTAKLAMDKALRNNPTHELSTIHNALNEIK